MKDDSGFFVKEEKNLLLTFVSELTLLLCYDGTGHHTVQLVHPQYHGHLTSNTGLSPLIIHLATYALVHIWHKPVGFLGWEASARGEKHNITMKRMCRRAPPAHTSVVQGFGPHLKQALLTRGCTDAAKESSVRSGWMTSCMTTTCSFPALLPVTSAQPPDGHLNTSFS